MTYLLTFFWHSIWHSFRHFFWHIFWHSSPTHFVTFFSDIHSGIFFDTLFWPIFWHHFSGWWGPTVILSSRLRPRAAHCDLQLAVEIRRCPLQHTAEEDGAEDEAAEAAAAVGQTALIIKSNNPHLTGGEYKYLKKWRPRFLCRKRAPSQWGPMNLPCNLVRRQSCQVWYLSAPCPVHSRKKSEIQTWVHTNKNYVRRKPGFIQTKTMWDPNLGSYKQKLCETKLGPIQKTTWEPRLG